MAEYAHPEVLVSTQWVADHGGDANVRIVESDEDVLLYTQGHVPGAVKIDWHTDLQDPLVRDFIGKEHFAELCRSKGSPTTRPSCSMATRTTGGRATHSGSSSSTATKMPDHGRRPQTLGGRWPRVVARSGADISATEYHAQEPDLTIRAFRQKCSNISWPASRWSMCAPRASTPANCCTCPTIRKKGAARRPYSRRGQHPLGESGGGRRHVQIGERIGEALLQGEQPYRAAAERSPIAASASAAAIRGSCSSICSASTT